MESEAIQVDTANWEEIERTITRDPKKLYKWVRNCNEKNGDFMPLADDYDNVRQVRAMCILVSSRKMSVQDFLSHLVNLDLFSVYDKHYFPLVKHRVPEIKLDFKNFPVLPQAAIDEITSTKAWAKVFAKHKW